MEVNKGVIFDVNGERNIISNIVAFTMQIKDRLLVKLYKSTIYQHELLLAMEELVKLKLIKREEGETYNPQLTIVAIESMKNEILTRFDIEFHDEVVNSIDLSFINKKPKF